MTHQEAFALLEEIAGSIEALGSKHSASHMRQAIEALKKPTTFRCEFCAYEHELDDRYGCPNCHGEGLN